VPNPELVQTTGSFMAHQPILRPDDSENAQPTNCSSREPVDPGITYPFLELTNTLAANGAGVRSADLALDLILNEIVEQACIATGATGAAIALVRGDEMVCRAGSGADAPGLGVRLDVRSGLTGACVQTRTVQLCADAESDPRVDPQVWRQAGIRSIVVMPLLEDDEVFGILQILSPSPNAFGELDIITLKALAQQVVENRRQAHETAGKLETRAVGVPIIVEESKSSGASSQAAEPVPVSEISSPGTQQAAREVVSKRVPRKSSPVPIDFWTAFLAVLVIGTAVLMGTLAGWRFGAGRRIAVGRGAAARRIGAGPKAATTRAAVSATAPTTKAPPGDAADAGSPPQENSAPRMPAPQQSLIARTKAPAEPPLGGLVIYEKGKMIYRLPPSPPAAPTSGQQPARSKQDPVILAGQISPDTKQVAEEVAAARLIHRVEPQYPADAAQQHLEGPVVLQAEIGRDGTVRNLSLVTGDPVLAASALQAVRQWRYQPYLLNGEPVGMRTTITVNFIHPAK
jgi:TonB family protein